jgi:hypothetical protein
MQTKLRKIIAFTLVTVFLFSISLTEAKSFSKQATSPEAAAKALYAATRRKNRAQALKVATPAVVKKLFANGSVDGLEFDSCQKERRGWWCGYRGEGSGMNMIVSKKGSSYRVTAISFFAD